MKKKIIAVVVAVLVWLPCILVLDGGPRAPYGEEQMGWTNVIGFVWFAFLGLGGFRLILPHWMLEELDAFMGDEDENE